MGASIGFQAPLCTAQRHMSAHTNIKVGIMPGMSKDSQAEMYRGTHCPARRSTRRAARAKGAEESV